MSKLYKTARGQNVNMDKIKMANESAIAVGNMKVNARGDLLGPGGTVAQTRNQIMDKVYAVEPAPYSPNMKNQNLTGEPTVESSKLKALKDLANNLSTPVAPEQATNPAPVPTTRGSLAGSVAKTTVVTQEPMPDPRDVKKSQGPSRI